MALFQDISEVEPTIVTMRLLVISAGQPSFPLEGTTTVPAGNLPLESLPAFVSLNGVLDLKKGDTVALVPTFNSGKKVVLSVGCQFIFTLLRESPF